MGKTIKVSIHDYYRGNIQYFIDVTVQDGENVEDAVFRNKGVAKAGESNIEWMEVGNG